MTVYSDGALTGMPSPVMGSMLAPARAQITDPSLDHQSLFDEIGNGLGAPPVSAAEAAFSDPTVALSEAWALVLDVLGFYQERLVNESYVGTALEDMSLFQLARMVGYAPDRGLSATCYVYYNLDASVLREVRIPAGSKIRAVPQPGEEPQTFETCADLTARYQWNGIGLSTTRSFSIAPTTTTIFARGTSTGLKQGDLVWIRQRPPGWNFDADDENGFYRDIYFLVDKVEAIRELEQTKIAVVGRYGRDTAPRGQDKEPAKSEAVSNDSSGTDAYYQMQIKGQSWVEATALTALSRAPASDETIKMKGFRKRVSIFGHSAPRRLEDPTNPKSERAWRIDPDDLPQVNVVDLEGHQTDIVPGTKLCIEIPDRSVQGEDIEMYDVKAVQLISRVAYGMTADATRVTLDRPWKSARSDQQGRTYEVYEEVVQKAVVHVGGIDLQVGKEPIPSVEAGLEHLELDGIYLGINPGRTMLLTGKPLPGDKPDVGQEPELLTVVSVSHPPYPFGDASTERLSQHHSGTTLQFKEKLKHRYDPKTVKIYGNVVKAIHGETYEEVLGSGNGAVEHQSFPLSRKPLSMRAVSTFPGAMPELTVTVADEDWEYVDTLARSQHAERQFSLWTDEAGASRVFFGNGRAGARLPSGRENVQARYRIGVGRVGNISAERLKLAVDHPLGVREVSNTRAEGGADPEPVSLVRSNTPLSTVALDRLVSRSDFLHLAKVYPGIAKAKVRYATVCGRQIVLVSILDNGIAPLGSDSPTCIALQGAMAAGQDGACSIFVVPGVLCPILISARIKLRAGMSWEETEVAVRTTLYDVFGFWRREMGQPARASEVLAAIQSVKSVESVRLIEFRKFTPFVSGRLNSVASVIEASDGGFDYQDGTARGAELALVQPHIPGCVVLEQDEQ